MIFRNTSPSPQKKKPHSCLCGLDNQESNVAMWSDLKDLSYREASKPWGSQCCKTYFKPPD